jgi:hypothetical protein
LRRSGWRWRPRSTSSATRRITRSRTLLVNRYSLIVETRKKSARFIFPFNV